MKDLQSTCSIAVVQAAPVLFNKSACLAKALALIEEAAGHGAELIVFPELFIPGYPYGMQALAEAAKKHGVYLSIGISERDPVTATLYNSNLMISPEGVIMNHRKLKPTGSERVVWGDADRDFFPVMDTPWGPMGSMICWESYMPLARCALYQKGVTLYISPNTNDNPEWQDTIRHIAIEGHCYFINCDMFFTKDTYPGDLAGADEVRRSAAAGAVSSTRQAMP